LRCGDDAGIDAEEIMRIAREVEIRLSQAADARDIAKLHADSWRRHYRGAYSNDYLDGDLDADRLAVWTERMNSHDGEHFTLLAEHRDGPVGFVHVVLDADCTWAERASPGLLRVERWNPS